MPTPIYTFSPNTVISSSEVNANFALLLQCLATTGGTMTGTLNARDIIPTADDTYHLGSVTNRWADIHVDEFKMPDLDRSHTITVKVSTNATADRTWNFDLGDDDFTLTGQNTGDQNIFGTISVSGQSNVVADSTNDTLTLVAGSGITITTNASTDAITFALNSTVMTGPDSSTDNAVARFNGTGGNALQNSGVTISDTNNMTGVATMSFQALEVMDWKTKAVTTIYQAATDGFVHCYSNGELNEELTITIKTDSSATPSTVRAKYLVSGSHDTYQSAMVPVKKGDYYQVTVDVTSGSDNTVVRWIPLGTAG